jgi:hypothetical protein
MDRMTPNTTPTIVPVLAFPLLCVLVVVMSATVVLGSSPKTTSFPLVVPLFATTIDAIVGSVVVMGVMINIGLGFTVGFRVDGCFVVAIGVMVGAVLRSLKNVVGAEDVGTSSGIDKIGFIVVVGVSMVGVTGTGRMVGVRAGAFDVLALTDTGDTVNVAVDEAGTFCCLSFEFLLLLLLIVGLDDGNVVGWFLCREDFSPFTSLA